MTCWRTATTCRRWTTPTCSARTPPPDVRRSDEAMRRHCWWLLAVAGLAAAAPRDLGDADLERNRRLLDKWRADPEHYARLRRDLKAFYELPESRQQALR